MGLGPAMTARQGTGAGDFPKYEERALIEVITGHAGQIGGVLVGVGVAHGGNKDQNFRIGYA